MVTESEDHHFSFCPKQTQSHKYFFYFADGTQTTFTCQITASQLRNVSTISTDSQRYLSLLNVKHQIYCH